MFTAMLGLDDLAAYIFDALSERFDDYLGSTALKDFAARVANDGCANEMDARMFFRQCGLSELDIEKYVAQFVAR